MKLSMRYLFVSAFASILAGAQPVQIQVTAADIAAGQPGRTGFLPLHTPFGAPRVEAPGAPKDSVFSVPSVPAPGFYRDDISNPANTPTMQQFVAHNVFVNPLNTAPNVFSQSATGPTLGDADTFLANLFQSNIIGIADEYTGGPQLRTVGQDAVLTFQTYHTTYDDTDMQMMVHAAARVLGTGMGQEVNLFFRAGTDICSNLGGTLAQQVCYSPDNAARMGFCAYHDSYLFDDIGRVVFTVQPYMNVAGCRVPNGSPNGRAVDSMANALSHEVFEMITDPTPQSNTAWGNYLTGEEMADICYYFVAPVVVNTKTYWIQAEYSNLYHACSWKQ